MDQNSTEKTFKEKIEDLKEVLRMQHLEPKLLDSLPDNFFQLDKRQLMYIWHFLSDKCIGELYGVHTYTVRKRRRDMGITQFTASIENLTHDINEQNDW